MLLNPKLIIINISIYNIINYISSLDIKFLILQTNNKNIFIIYLMLTILNLTMSYQ